MSSAALDFWRTVRLARLDGLRGLSHSPVLTESVILRLAAEFQGFARDLHDETVEAVLTTLPAPVDLHYLLRSPYRTARRLDRGNADAHTLDSDFGLFGLRLWPTLTEHFPARAAGWRQQLTALLAVRNGIAHSDRVRLVRLAGSGVRLDRESADHWRFMLDGLAGAMDTVVADHINQVYGIRPW